MDAFELGRTFPEVEIDPRLVFDNPTIEQLSQAIVDLPKTERTKSVESVPQFCSRQKNRCEFQDCCLAFES